MKVRLGKSKPVGTLLILDKWAQYGKQDKNVAEWIQPNSELAYHVVGYERSLNFLGFGYGNEHQIHSVGGIVLREEGKLSNDYGIQNYLQSCYQVLNRNGGKFDMFLTIGGWTLSDPFPKIAANPTYRCNAISCVVS